MSSSKQIQNGFDANLLRNIRGNGYSKLLPLITATYQGEISLISNYGKIPSQFTSLDISKRRRIQSSEYKTRMNSNLKGNIPMQTKNAQFSLKFPQKSACFPKRSAKINLKKFSNFKPSKNTSPGHSSINISRLIATPIRSRKNASRYANIAYTFSKELQDLNSSSSENWDIMEARNLTVENNY